MKLTDIHIDRYGPLPRFTHECEDNFEVFYGPNESGKTLLLEAVLKLLEPDIETAIPHVSRVDESPSGHVVVETGDTDQKLGDGMVLGDLVDLSPQHLRNIFVIRDSDLQLRDEHEFYDSVTQQIGDLHTNEIDAIQSRLVVHGRLTSVDGRGLSSARSRSNAAEVRDQTTTLAADIREYIGDAEASDIAAAEREAVAVTTELQRCEDERAIQEAAETWDTHATLTERLTTYRDAIEQLDDEVSQSTLNELERLDREIVAAEDEIEDLESKRSSLREERRQLKTETDSVEAALVPLEARADDVAKVTRVLASFRESHGESIGASRGMPFAKYTALVGLGLGGVAAIVGSTIAGVLLAVLGGMAAGWYGLQHRSVTATEREQEQVLQQAQDAGLDVTTIAEIGPATRAFRDELAGLQDRRDELVRQIGVKDELIDECTDDLETAREQRRSNREKRHTLLREVDAANIEEYRERVAAQETLKRKRDQAVQSLTDALGTPSTTEPEPEPPLEHWEGALETMVADVDENVDADEYDPDRLPALREQQEELTQRREELTEQLEAHERRLREFDDRIQALSTEPFLDDSVSLPSRSVEGLRDVVHELNQLVEQIERDADIAREALDIFDNIQSEEEQKITDLFGTESRATDVFQTITADRYTGVTYDAEERVIQVHTNGQEVFTPTQLSHGTTEQLYFSARVGLAEQLLSSEPGFFLLDDAFLPADRRRLQEGFEVLRELAADGWQILYFTAKDEVGTDLVKTHDLRCQLLDPLG
ncbi:AAA family ATPase [Halorubrum sp. AD140]|uniref:ATP-binding protein n=1 Tax=Halorubrum sp. AD140 TaxID=3050073 RepID=UPI002ACCC901|nr:AAA family ATPase [Halorubrum sp. AD140]MDZ5811761.1 AAA family ATPase [Halorubrum sp. AD140]